MNMKIVLWMIVFFIIQFIVITSYISKEKNQIMHINNKLSNIEFEYKEIRKTLSSIENVSNSNLAVEDCQYQNIKNLSPTIDNKKMLDILTNRLSEISDLLRKKLDKYQDFGLYLEDSIIFNDTEYSSEKYNLITDENFKESLIVLDEIINRTIESGEFTWWDTEQLNNLATKLDYNKRLYIMNKLSDAYVSNGIKGDFINFNLDNVKQDEY